MRTAVGHHVGQIMLAVRLELIQSVRYEVDGYITECGICL